jgi:NAD(P)-dependent dehydrogenase (short-subunit alcohol dehydrogenase family)
MSGRLDGRRAVVTGAAQGLGQGFATRLATDGATIVLVDRQDAGETLARIGQAGGSAVQITADLTDLAALPALCERIVAEQGAVDLLVNDAGIYPFQPVPQITLADWRRVFATNLDAPFFLAQGFLPVMRARSGVASSIFRPTPFGRWIRTSATTSPRKPRSWVSPARWRRRSAMTG